MEYQQEKLPISVLVPTINRPVSLKQMIDNLMSKAYIPDQVIVVDQSTDANVIAHNKATINHYENLCHIIYCHQATASLTMARNAALLNATNEIVVLSDDDVDVFPYTLKSIADIMQKKDIALIAGIDVNAERSSTNLGYLLGTKSFKNRKIGHVTLSMLGRYPDKVIGEVETQWAMGYFVTVKKSLLDKWKLQWDEKLTSYAYAEDLDFSYRYYKLAKAEGLKCILSDKVKVAHLASKEYRVPTRKSTYMYVLNRAYLSHKHNMGWKSQIAMAWCDLWRIFERFIKNESPNDMVNALKLCRELKRNNYHNLSEFY